MIASWRIGEQEKFTEIFVALIRLREAMTDYTRLMAMEIDDKFVKYFAD